MRQKYGKSMAKAQKRLICRVNKQLLPLFCEFHCYMEYSTCLNAVNAANAAAKCTDVNAVIIQYHPL